MVDFFAGIILGLVLGYILKKYNWFTTIESDVAKEFVSVKKEVVNTVSNTATVNVVSNTVSTANT